jgi:hypothetical protein
MKQGEITILRVHKSTRNKLKRLAIAKRESYDEIINRLLGYENNGTDDLEKKRQKLLNKGISKEIVNLVGVMPKISLKEEKAIVRRAIVKKMSK